VLGYALFECRGKSLLAAIVTCAHEKKVVEVQMHAFEARIDVS
jgi:hypothetical protein